MIETQSDQLRDAQASRKSEVEHRAITHARYGFGVGRVDQGLNLRPGERSDQCLVGLLHWNRPDAKRLIEADGGAILEEPEKRPDRCQSRVARSRRVATDLLDVIEKGQDHGHTDILDFHLRRQLAKPLGGECHEQLKAIGIGVASVWAGALVARKMFTEETGEVRCERGHGAPT